MAISLSGIGSGLDIQGLVSQLVQAESQAKTVPLNSREASYKADLSALGQLKSSLSKFQDAASTLADNDQLLKLSATTGDKGLFSAVATSGAVAGNYQIEVRNLAASQKLVSTGFSSESSSVGTGTLNITSGANSFVVNILSGEESLTDIMDAINNQSENTSVSASIVNVDDGLGGKEARLILTSKSTGTANEITISVSDDDGDNTNSSGLSSLAYDTSNGVSNLSEQVAAQNSLIRIDGLDITSNSNSIDDAISGVTLSLKSTNIDETISLSISVDSEETTSSVQAFIDSYNKLVDTYTSLTSYNSDTGKSGKLQGDFATRQIMQEVRAILRETVDATDYPSLFSTGIGIDQYGKMSLDSSRFKSVLSSRPEALTKLLSGDTGIARMIEDRLKTALEVGGNFDNRNSSIQDSLERITAEREKLEVRMTSLESSLLKQFIAMDILVAQYGATGDYLSQQLSSLPGFAQKSK